MLLSLSGGNTLAVGSSAVQAVYRGSELKHFNPKAIPGLELYLNAKVASSITLNSGNVSEWRDLSGNDRHAAQATAANQPAYGTGTWLGRPSVNFTAGSSHFLSFTPFVLTTSTVFFALEPTSATGGDIMQIATAAAGQANRWTFASGGGGYREFGVRCGANPGAGAALTNSVGADGVFAQSPVLLTATYNGGGQSSVASYGLRKNRTGLTVQTSGAFLTAASAATIGVRGDRVGYISMRLGLILVYNRVLTAAEIAAVENWAVLEYPIA